MTNIEQTNDSLKYFELKSSCMKEHVTMLTTNCMTFFLYLFKIKSKLARYVNFLVTGFLLSPNATQGNECLYCDMHCFIICAICSMRYLSFDMLSSTSE